MSEDLFEAMDNIEMHVEDLMKELDKEQYENAKYTMIQIKNWVSIISQEIDEKLKS